MLSKEILKEFLNCMIIITVVYLVVLFLLLIYKKHSKKKKPNLKSINMSCPFIGLKPEVATTILDSIDYDVDMSNADEASISYNKRKEKEIERYYKFEVTIDKWIWKCTLSIISGIILLLLAFNLLDEDTISASYIVFIYIGILFGSSVV